MKIYVKWKTYMSIQVMLSRVKLDRTPHKKINEKIK